MKPLSPAEVNAINRLVRKGLCPKEIAARVGRSTNAVSRVKRGLVVGRKLKINGMDRIDLMAWYNARKALPTMAQIARRYGVSAQYVRDICRKMEQMERL